MTDRDELLRELRERFQGQRFPPAADRSQEVRLVHADLAGYDGQVAGIVARALRGVTAEPAWLRPNLELGARIEALLANAADSERAVLEQYLGYARHLDALLALAARAIESAAPRNPGSR